LIQTQKRIAMIFKDIKLLDKDFELREHQYLVTDGAYITYIGSEPQPEEGHRVIDGNNKFIMPAFYNTHSHIPMTILRGYGGGVDLHTWLNDYVWPFEAKFNAQEKYWGAALGACELIRSGCISISDMYYDLAVYIQALDKLGMKGNMNNGLLTFDETASYYNDNSYRDTLSLIDWLKHNNTHGRFKVEVGIHSDYGSRRKSVLEVCDYAKQYNMNIHVHVSETKKEHQDSIEKRGMTPVEYLKDCGVFDHLVTAAHCVWLSENDMQIMKDAGAFVAHCPSSNLKLGSGIAPIKKYYDKGMHVTIGTDGASSNNNLNMLEEIHLAAMLSKGASLDANAIPDKEILRMATYNGARAQGRNDCGKLDVGMKADIIMFDLDRPHLQPDYDTIANILFSAQSSDIVMTVCDGEVLYENGEIKLADEEKIIAEANKAFKDVCARL